MEKGLLAWLKGEKRALLFLSFPHIVLACSHKKDVWGKFTRSREHLDIAVKSCSHGTYCRRRKRGKGGKERELKNTHFDLVGLGQKFSYSTWQRRGDINLRVRVRGGGEIFS